MIKLAYKKLSASETLPSADSLILSLIAEWQARFPIDNLDFKPISLIMKIETIFHKLLSRDPSHTFIKHQAIQAFFSKILDHSLLVQNSENRIEKWLQMMMGTGMIPMKWMAVVKRDKDNYFIDNIVCAAAFNPADHLVHMCSSLQAGELNHLAVAVTRLLNFGDSETPLVTIPCLNDTIMISPVHAETKITEHQKKFIQKMYLRQLKMQNLENNLAWKDASLLFLQRLLTANSASTAIQAITEGLVDYMPFKRCALFLYSSAENKGFGVSSYNLDFPSVQEMTRSLQLALLKKHFLTLSDFQPLYFSNASDVFPENYIRDFRLKSLVILPLFVQSENKLLGAAILDQGQGSQFQVSTETLSTLIKFGQFAGEVLFSFWGEALQQFSQTKGILTEREKEVLKLISEGASIHEAAEFLHLSSYTVRDYVSAIIQKLEAKNRTDAAVKAIKMKLIS